MATWLERIRERNSWKLFTALFRADPALATLWWGVLLLRGTLPVGFAIGMGRLVGAVQQGTPLTVPLTIVGVAFVLLQILAPIHRALSANLGDRAAVALEGFLAAPELQQGVAEVSVQIRLVRRQSDRPRVGVCRAGVVPPPEEHSADVRVGAPVARHEQNVRLVGQVEREVDRHVREHDGVVKGYEQILVHSASRS